MTDAELIYNACLRAENRLEQMSGRVGYLPREIQIALLSVQTLREEIGRGLAEQRPQ